MKMKLVSYNNKTKTKTILLEYNATEAKIQIKRIKLPKSFMLQIIAKI